LIGLHQAVDHFETYLRLRATTLKNVEPQFRSFLACLFNQHFKKDLGELRLSCGDLFVRDEGEQLLANITKDLGVTFRAMGKLLNLLVQIFNIELVILLGTNPSNFSKYFTFHAQFLINSFSN